MVGGDTVRTLQPNEPSSTAHLIFTDQNQNGIAKIGDSANPEHETILRTWNEPDEICIFFAN